MNLHYKRLVVLNNLQTKIYIAMLFIALNVQGAGQPPLTHSLTEIIPPTSIPALKLQNMDEEDVDIKTMKGKVIVINFWATWCPPCRREMTSLEKLYLATKDKNVIVLAVNVGEEVETVFPFINSIEPSPSFPILFDTDSIAMQQWKAFGLPTTYIVDANGYIVYKAIGGREFDHPNILNKVINLSTRNKNEIK